MNVLVKYNINYMKEPVDDWIQDSNKNIFFAHTIEETIQILNENKIDKIFMELNNIEEINFIEYVNKYFPKTKILVITNEYNENLLEAIKRGMFSILKEPLNIKTILSNL